MDYSKVGGGSRKRKIWMVHQSENDDPTSIDKEEDEERKMEKFFDLIQCIRESRERLVPNQNGLVEEKKKKQGKVWEPRFQLEDFAQDYAAASKSKQKSADRQETHALDLDLNLSL
ncbi:hypothetical protein L6164_034818 [Bauhinia variegata]|uniref:Uncharacterized protein n=1 Tax=Bauhinia variegata TaxID=167791 RepID=A0ACB9KWF0_BAUVA|nr:hypothetical protein L6164_034818 [Bauhinia variegata]